MKNNTVVSTILKAVGLGMSVAVLTLSILGATTTEANIVMLSLGLLALALNTLREPK